MPRPQLIMYKHWDDMSSFVNKKEIYIDRTRIYSILVKKKDFRYYSVVGCDMVAKATFW